MKKKTVFIKRYPSEGQLPDYATDKTTNIGQCFYNKLIGRWCDQNYKTVDVEFYFEEIELPSEEDMEDHLLNHWVENRVSVKRGMNFILNKLKGEIK